MRAGGTAFEPPYVTAPWGSDRALVAASILYGALVVSAHDAWRLLHAECIDPHDLPDHTSLTATIVAIVGAAILAGVAARSDDDAWMEPSLVAWIALDLVTHLSANAWGVFSFAAHAAAFVALVLVLAERRGAQSHETSDRLAFALASSVFALATTPWAPVFLEGSGALACIAFVAPLALAVLALRRLRARRAWLAEATSGRAASTYERQPIAGTGEGQALGLLPLAGYEGAVDVILSARTPASGAYRGGSHPLGLVASDGRLRPLLASTLASAAAASIALPALAAMVLAAVDRREPLPPMTSQVYFEIESAGDEPRQPLRYAIRVGRCERELTDSDENRTSSLDGALESSLELPRTHVDSTVVATRALANGNVVARYRTSSIRTLAGAGVAAAVDESVKDEMTRRGGTQLEAEATPFGETVASQLRPAPDMDAESRELIQQMRLARRGLSAPFPDAPLGEGARWKAVRTTTEDGITSVGTYHYELKHREGSQVTLERTFEVHAQGTGYIAVDEQFKLNALDATGSATSTVDLESLNPVSEVTDSDETLSAEVRAKTLGITGAPVHVLSTLHRHVVRMRMTGGE